MLKNWCTLFGILVVFSLKNTSSTSREVILLGNSLRCMRFLKKEKTSQLRPHRSWISSNSATTGELQKFSPLLSIRGGMPLSDTAPWKPHFSLLTDSNGEIWVEPGNPTCQESLQKIDVSLESSAFIDPDDADQNCSGMIRLVRLNGTHRIARRRTAPDEAHSNYTDHHGPSLPPTLEHVPLPLDRDSNFALEENALPAPSGSGGSPSLPGGGVDLDLTWAVRDGDWAFAAQCVAADASRTALNRQLIEAAGDGDVNAIARLVALGADPAAEDLVAGGTGWRALHRAASRGRADAAEALVRAGAPVDARADAAGGLGFGVTALHLAAVRGHAAAAARLLALGADAAAEDTLGHTPLDLAASAGHAAVCELLRRK
jgi:hypothetical protein